MGTDSAGGLGDLAPHAPPAPGSRAAYLAAILSEFGLARPDARAAALIAEFGSIGALADASEERLRKCFGSDRQLLASFLAARKIISAGIRETALRTPLDPRSADFHRYLLHRLAHRQDEILLGFFADRDGGFIAECVLGVGDGRSVGISARAAMRRAVALQAERFLLAHNHPSGDCAPSRKDIESTREIDAQSDVLGITLLDHLIVGGPAVYSIREGRIV